METDAEKRILKAIGKLETTTGKLNGNVATLCADSKNQGREIGDLKRSSHDLNNSVVTLQSDYQHEKETTQKFTTEMDKVKKELSDVKLNCSSHHSGNPTTTTAVPSPDKPIGNITNAVKQHWQPTSIFFIIAALVYLLSGGKINLLEQ